MTTKKGTSADTISMCITAEAVERRTDDGVVTEKAIDSRSAPEMVFGRFVIDPGVQLDAHVHSADTIAYCVRGRCSFQVGDDLGQGFEIGPGDYAYIPAGTVHTEATGEDGVELVFARDRQGGETMGVEIG